jgi:hypothetical protein
VVSIAAGWGSVALRDTFLLAANCDENAIQPVHSLLISFFG